MPEFTAHCNRVAVEDGHTESVSIELDSKPSEQEILAAWREFQPLRGENLSTAPLQPVEYNSAEDRPQPRLDRMRGRGMTADRRTTAPLYFYWIGNSRCFLTIRFGERLALRCLNAELLASENKLCRVGMSGGVGRAAR